MWSRGVVASPDMLAALDDETFLHAAEVRAALRVVSDTPAHNLVPHSAETRAAWRAHAQAVWCSS
jgi:hypothetical protein